MQIAIVVVVVVVVVAVVVQVATSAAENTGHLFSLLLSCGFYFLPFFPLFFQFPLLQLGFSISPFP